MTREDEDQKFISAKLQLGIVQKENDYEIDRKKTFETRAGIFIGFSGAMLAFFTKNINFDIFKNVQPEEFVQYAIIFSLFFVFPLFFLGISLFYFISVISARKYDRFSLDIGFDQESTKLSEEENAFYIMENYISVVKNNKKINEKKGLNFVKGTIFLTLSLGLTLVMYIISIF